jgi:hypothetical protein
MQFANDHWSAALLFSSRPLFSGVFLHDIFQNNKEDIGVGVIILKQSQ